MKRWIIRKRERGRWRVVTLEEAEVSVHGGHERFGEPEGHDRGVGGAGTQWGEGFRRVRGLGFWPFGLRRVRDYQTDRKILTFRVSIALSH